MYILNLELINYRLFKESSFKFNKGINIIFGYNSTGKTSILEAIDLILTGIAINNENIINFGSDFANIFANIIKDNITHNLKLIIKKIDEQKLRKFFFLNEKRIKNYEELRNNFSIIFLSLKDILLVNSEPCVKRDFLDRFLIVLFKDYYDSLINYKKTLFNKNKLLYNLKINQSIDYEMLDILNENIVNYSVFISLKRIEIFYRIKEHINNYLKFLLPNFEFSFIYDISGIYKIDIEKVNLNQEVLRNFYFQAINKNKKKELSIYKSVIGASKDNFEILIKNSNNINVKYFLSLSQINLLSLAIFFSLKKIMKQFFNYDPILLLDEPFVYLDKNNVKKVLNLLFENTQSIFTTNNIDLLHFIFDSFDNINVIKLKTE
jgi:DNA replication and repair protein RecF